MDVTCDRCSTAYEFDDALVSERGTTVKCTNCGYQFKVRRVAQASSPERWLVRTIDGRELEFRALRELQGAIAQTVISREDVLSRGSARPRRLGSIAELEPFFAKASGQPFGYETPTISGGPLDMQRRATTPMGTRLRAGQSPTAQQGPSATPFPGVIVSPAGAPAPPSAEPPRMDGTGGPTQSENEVARSKDGADVQRTSPIATDDVAPPPARLPSVDVGQAGVRDQARHAPSAPASDSAREEPKPVSSGEPKPSAAVVPPASPSSSGRNSYANSGRNSFANEDSFTESHRRPGAARWIVGFVVAGMFALAFTTVGRKFLVPSAPPASSGSGARDERISALLREGEESLLEGDLEGAKEHFDKASVFSERDPRVALNLAHLVMVRADLLWLRVRLLPDNDPELGAARHELEQIVQRARKAVDRAAELAPNDPVVSRARIDALRLDGDIEGARRLVSGIVAASSQPDNALALAELDLAEARPDWATVVGRLRTALSGDQNLGRARSMLVYALARSGDLNAAKAELERLAALPRQHPLLRPLRAFLAREGSGASANAVASAASQPPPTSSAAASAASPAQGRDRAPSSAGRPKSDGKAPEDSVGSPPGIDTSDLPGFKPEAPRTRPPPPPTRTSTPTALPPGVDTSDLPGFK
jgi:predicted Zn finger-like uncharacterized protein